ncbi:Ig-like domain-containing protein [Dawidia soli]|uniref:Tandem-95 repeat protein n=1 Tax=Dawidia soli TaxID=2782352 RepID=A0AAP2DC79_9BACT|nr:Ig-like domain-containing protein [Dawidia soli]MBT1688005.1 tandem-95 repeat protein [Dawidia soli]
MLAGTAPDFNRALLTAVITLGVPGEDSLLIRPVTSGEGITLQGRKVLYKGVVVGTYQPALAWSSLTVRFNERATAASITAVIRSLAYTNVNTVNPTVAPRNIQVAVSDGYGSVSTTSVVWIEILMPRPAPVATSDYYRVSEGQTSLVIPAPGVLKNDYHPDKRPFEAKLTRDTPVGHVVVGRDGSVHYTPQPGTTGTYTATYTNCDNWGVCVSETITFQVGGENEAPQPIPDHYPLKEHQGLFIGSVGNGVLGNDTDPNSGSGIVLTASLVSSPEHGTLTFYPNGTFLYHPAADYHGDDTFRYKACDTDNACAESIVTIAVADVDYPPYVPDIILAVPDTTWLTSDLLQNVINYDKDVLQATFLTEPTWGKLVHLADESTFSYISRSNQEGIERLLYQVCDGSMQCDTAAVVITVTNANNRPAVFLPAILSAREDTPTPLSDISFADPDAGNNPVRVTFEAIQTGSAMTAGTLPPGLSIVRTGSRIINITGPISSINTWLKEQGLMYTPVKDATSGQSIRVVINDLGNTGSGGAQQAAVSKSVAIIPVNDAPVNSLPGDQTMKENELLVLTGTKAIRIHDVDAGDARISVTIAATGGVLVVSPISGGEIGAGVSSLVLTGRLDSINAALTALAFRPTRSGAAVITVTTNDLGNVGEGGPQIVTGAIHIKIAATPAVIMRVTALSPDGLYKAGDHITLAVQFNHSVWVSQGVPTLGLEAGEGSQAAYQGGSGTPQLLFDYTVQAGDITPRLEYAGRQALLLNGALLRDSLATDATVVLPMPGTASSLKGTSYLSIDGIPPAPPQIMIPAHNSTIEGDILVMAGTSEAGSRVLISMDGNAIGTTVADAVGGWDYQHAEALYVGKHTLTLQATDSAGNTSTSSGVTTLFVTRGTIVNNEEDEHRATPRAYPVPAKDILFINLGTNVQTPLGIGFVDSRGITHSNADWEWQGHTLAVNVSSLSGGLYVLLLKLENGQYKERILIVR